MRAPDRVDACFRQPPVSDLPLGDEILQGARDIFDRHARINAVLIEEVDAVSSKPLQRCVRNRPDVLGTAVEAAAASPSREIDVEAEFRGDDDLVTDRL